jgi:hypothetical protein
MFRDVEYHDVLKIKFTTDIFENAPPQIGEIKSIIICGREVLTKPATITKEGFNSEYSMKIAPNQSEALIIETIMWLRIGEDQRMLPRRPVATFSMDIVSQIEETPILSGQVAGMEAVNLTYGNVVSFPDVHAVLPGEALFPFKLLKPLV